MSMGVFGEFNVTVSQPTITDPKYPNMHLTTKSLINIGGGMIKGKMLDRSSMISIKEHEDVVSPLNLTKRTQQQLDISLERSINTLKEFRKVNATTTNRSRISNSKLGDGILLNGEINTTHSSFKNTNFLTSAEKKLAESKQLMNVERSLTKLHEHSSKNFSLRDVKVQSYQSPSNFSRVYARNPVEVIHGSAQTQTMRKVLNDVLSNTSAMKTIQPKDLRTQQMNNISEMIREKRQQALSPGVVKHVTPTSANYFNHMRNETKDLIHALNME